MIKGYRFLRLYCQQHDWAAGLSASVLIAIFGATLFVSLEYPNVIFQWLSSDILLNGMTMLAMMAFIGGVSLSLLCLSFCPCSKQDEVDKFSYRHRPVMCEALKGIKNLGGNPKRRRRLDNNASS